MGWLSDVADNVGDAFSDAGDTLFGNEGGFDLNPFNEGPVTDAVANNPIVGGITGGTIGFMINPALSLAGTAIGAGVGAAQQNIEEQNFEEAMMDLQIGMTEQQMETQQEAYARQNEYRSQQFNLQQAGLSLERQNVIGQQNTIQQTSDIEQQMSEREQEQLGTQQAHLSQQQAVRDDITANQVANLGTQQDIRAEQFAGQERAGQRNIALAQREIEHLQQEENYQARRTRRKGERRIASQTAMAAKAGGAAQFQEGTSATRRTEENRELLDEDISRIRARGELNRARRQRDIDLIQSQLQTGENVLGMQGEITENQQSTQQLQNQMSQQQTEFQIGQADYQIAQLGDQQQISQLQTEQQLSDLETEQGMLELQQEESAMNYSFESDMAELEHFQTQAELGATHAMQVLGRDYAQDQYPWETATAALNAAGSVFEFGMNMGTTVLGM